MGVDEGNIQVMDGFRNDNGNLSNNYKYFYRYILTSSNYGVVDDHISHIQRIRSDNATQKCCENLRPSEDKCSCLRKLVRRHRFCCVIGSILTVSLLRPT